MALRGALVDRARVVTPEGSSQKVEGTTTFTKEGEVTGPWFKCRLGVENPAPETVADGRVKATQNDLILLYWRTAVDGTAVELDADDVLEVVSNQEGTHYWQLTVKPLLIRKKRVMLGAGYARVKRVHEPVPA